MKTAFKNLFLFILILLTAFSFSVAGETALSSGSWTDYGNYRENSAQAGRFTLLKYSPDGKYIYSFGTDSIIRKWDNESGEILFENKCPYLDSSKGIERYGFADISPDGKYVLVSHWMQNMYEVTAELLMYDLNTKQVKFSAHPPFSLIPYGSPGPPVYVFGAGIWGMFSFDGSVFVGNVNLSLEYSLYTETGSHTLMNSSDGTQIGKSKGGSLRMQAISKDNKNYAYFFTISYDYNTHFPSVYGLRLNDTNVYLNNYIDNLAFTNDSKNLAWIANDLNRRTLLRWDTEKNEKLPETLFEQVDGFSANMLFTNDDRFFVSETGSGIAFYQYPTAVKAFDMNFDFMQNYAKMSMNPVLNEIAVGGKDGVLRIIKLDKAGQELVSVFRADTTVVLKSTALGFKDYSYGEPDDWLWDFGDGTTSTERNPQHTYNQSGTFTVSLIATKSTVADTSIKVNYIRVDEPTGVSDLTADNMYSVNPNPAYDYIELPLNLPENTDVIIFSALGTQMYTGKAKGRIDVSGFSPGVYFIKIQTKVCKFVKI
ncbi:MAG: PKD domain-containing protein [Bacteroidota bacterium]